jgi:outer membrane protein assembly factor BamB
MFDFEHPRPESKRIRRRTRPSSAVRQPARDLPHPRDMKQPLCLLALAFLFLTGAASAQSTTDWPQFRGPNATGIADRANPPTEFGPTKALAWKTPLPEGHSSPSIWGDRIFVTAVDKSAGRLEVIALDRSSGRIVWRQSVTPSQLEQPHAISNPASATAAADGKRVYAYFGSYGVVAYEWNGKLAWEARLPMSAAIFGTGTSPVIAGDLVLINRDYRPKPELLAFSASDGKLAWTATLPPSRQGGPQTSHATPVIWKDEVILHRPGGISAHALKDGSLRWWIQLSSSGTATPAVSGDVIYVNAFAASTDTLEPVPLPPFGELKQKMDKNGDGKISRDEFPPDFNFLRRPNIPNELPAHYSVQSFFTGVDVNKDGGVDEAEYATIGELGKNVMSNRNHGVTAVKPGGEGDVTATAVLWREQRSVPEVPSPLFYQGRLYTIVNGGIVTCLDGATGKVLYRERINAPGPYFSAPVAAAGRIYTASSEGVVSVLASGDTLKILARNDIGEPIFATPAPVGDTLYIRSSRHLWAFKAK